MLLPSDTSCAIRWLKLLSGYFSTAAIVVTACKEIIDKQRVSKAFLF